MQDSETRRPGRAFAGQVALVSGARQGIGAAVARAFIGEGARVAALVHKPEQAQEVEDWLASAGICVTADVTDEGECRAAVRECEDQLGACDVLVNAAGIAISKKFVDTDQDTWRRVIATDLDGPYHLIRAALPAMLARGSGVVISIASTAGLQGGRFIAAYAAAKHGLVGLTRALAAEYSGSGVSFNCVCPAFVDTPMTERTIENIVQKTGRSREAALRALLIDQGGRLIAPEEVAATCLMLASETGKSISGEAIVIGRGT
ncbi:MAG: SDR family oxidoreductase [Chloroflexi bacterium]|nr:MAG: SDR family oxidoreductase [Chloroflexota bacterium]